MLAIADRAIVHSEHARELVARQLGHGDKLHIVPHGHYIGVYPRGSASRAEVRERLKLGEDDYVYLAFGQIRPYKRLSELVRAFRALPDDGVALVIAGEPRDGDDATALRALASGDRRIRLDLRRVPVLEVAELHDAADACVFAYRDMFSSGSALLALSWGLPIVVPANSSGTEIVEPPGVEAFEPGDLTAALHAVRSRDQSARRDAAYRAAARCDWGQVAGLTEEVYRLAIADRAAAGSLPVARS